MNHALLAARLVAWPLLTFTIYIIYYAVQEHLRLGQQHTRLCTSIVRILLLPPLYALEAALSLALPTWEPLFVMFRGLCEAGVVAAFLQFLVETMTPEHISIDNVQSHVFPCAAPWRVKIIMLGILQYTVVMAVLWPTTLFAWAGNVYVHPSKFSYRAAYLYCALVRNVSQMLAIYSLLMFYRAMHAKLNCAMTHPWLKLACIKLVVFFTFWQSLLLAWLEHRGQVDHDTSTYLANTIVSIEMVIFAGMHSFAFGAKNIVTYGPRLTNQNMDKILAQDARNSPSLTAANIICASLNPHAIALEVKHYRDILTAQRTTHNPPPMFSDVAEYAEL